MLTLFSLAVVKIGLLTFHTLSLIALLLLGRLVTSENRPVKGLAYALALVNAGYVLVYGLILVDAHLVSFLVSDWLAQLLGHY